LKVVGGLPLRTNPTQASGYPLYSSRQPSCLRSCGVPLLSLAESFTGIHYISINPFNGNR